MPRPDAVLFCRGVLSVVGVRQKVATRGPPPYGQRAIRDNRRHESEVHQKVSIDSIHCKPAK